MSNRQPSEPGSWREAEGILEGVFKPGEADKALRHARGDYEAELTELEKLRAEKAERDALLGEALAKVGTLSVLLVVMLEYADAYCRGVAPYVDEETRTRHNKRLTAARDAVASMFSDVNTEADQ